MTRCWSKTVSIGDLVYHVDDPRHCGRVKMINWSHMATVQWIETGWITECELLKLKRWRRGHDEELASAWRKA